MAETEAAVTYVGDRLPVDRQETHPIFMLAAFKSLKANASFFAT